MRAADVEFAGLAVARGWLGREAEERVLAEADRYQALGLDKSVDEILQEEGELSAAQVRSLRETLGWSLRTPRLGDYEILRRVGVGGMGTVFEARHVRLNVRVALKVLFPRLARDRLLRERFLGEGRALARLNHPHLVHALDAGRDGKYCFLALEYIEGENLLQFLAREGPLPPARSLAIVEAVLGALAALEERRLVHCDVKPANILLGASGLVKLADLGLLRSVADAGAGGERTLCGTPHYLSPEQACGSELLDSRSDLYNLGATWFHLLAGRPPFPGATTREILRAHVDRAPPAFAALGRQVPPAMENVIGRWLAKRPEERPADALAALAELRALARALAAGGESAALPAAAVPAAASVARVPPGRKRAAAATLAVLLVLALLAFLALSGRGGRRDRDAAPPPPLAMETPPAAPPRDPLAGRQGAAPAVASRGPAPAARTPPAAGAAPPAAGERRGPISLQPNVEQVGRPPPAPGGAGEEQPPPRAPGRAVEGRLAGTARALLGEAASRIQEADFAGAAARLKSAHPLARSFHARFTILGLGETDPWYAILGYSFDEAGEILDFRGPPGSWEVRAGAAVSRTGEALDSLAWFTPPLRIEGEAAATPIAIGLGRLRVEIDGSNARSWLEDAEARPVAGAAPSSPPGALAGGRFAVTFREGAVGVEAGGTARELVASVPEKGRLVLVLPGGGALFWLRVTGRIDGIWAGERLRLLTATTR